MRIAFLIRSLTGGGAERVCVLLANGLAAKGHEVTVVTVKPESEDAYTLAPQVQRVVLNASLDTPRRQESVLGKNWGLLTAIRQTTKNLAPQVVVSFVHMVNIRVVLALLWAGVPVIVTEHNDSKHSTLHAFWRLTRRLVYPWASHLVSVSEGVDEDFAWMAPTRRSVIYNPVLIPGPSTRPDAGPRADEGPLWLLAMGRLVPQKGFDLLIQAFGQLAEDHPRWHLRILGEGEERANLEAQIRRAGLEERVSLPGFVSDPDILLGSGDLFVVSSRWEGFCLALAEAMAAGLPAVSFDCPSGPSELITHEHDGLLVEPENVEALTEALDQMMTDSALRETFGARARQSVARFSVERIVAQWELLLGEMAANATPAPRT